MVLRHWLYLNNIMAVAAVRILAKEPLSSATALLLVQLGLSGVYSRDTAACLLAVTGNDCKLTDMTWLCWPLTATIIQHIWCLVVSPTIPSADIGLRRLSYFVIRYDSVNSNGT
jgi:hypothetical protein